MAQQDTDPAGQLATGEVKRPGRWQTFSALRHKDYRYLWAASAFISSGNQIQQVTMGWLVWELSRSPFWVGTVLGIRALPILLVGPLAGIAVDRLDRKRLFLAAQLSLVILAFLFALDVQLGQVNVYHALLFSFLLGLDSSLNQPVRQALIVNTVAPQDLTNAIALNNVASGVVQSIAWLIGGTLIGVLGVSGNFFIQSAAYLIVFFIILPMRTPYREATAVPASVGKNFTEGLRHIRGDLTLLLLIVLVFIPSIFVHSTQNLLSVFAEDVLHGGPFELGLLGASMGIGSLMATFTIVSGQFPNPGQAEHGIHSPGDRRSHLIWPIFRPRPIPGFDRGPGFLQRRLPSGQ